MANDNGITRPDPVIGTPAHDAQLFPGQQHHPDTCAIRSQEFIIDQFTGEHHPEDYYVKEAEDHGWYAPGQGTSMENVGKLLELHHIPIHSYADANIYNLTSELAQGHKVIIGVDSAELWHNGTILHDISHKLGLTGADHAVVVSGIDTSDPHHVNVIISDPGTGQAAASYPLEQFIDAWKDSHFFMVATQNPPPQAQHLPEMANFDYFQGHIDHIGSFSYDDFEKISHSMSGFPGVTHQLHNLFLSGLETDPFAHHDTSHHDTEHHGMLQDLLSGIAGKAESIASHSLPHEFAQVLFDEHTHPTHDAHVDDIFHHDAPAHDEFAGHPMDDGF